MTFTHALSTNNYGPAKFIVSANAYEGTHTTIAAALTSASSGDTIFIRPGTYTENPTLKAGVNLCAYICDGFTPNVTIIGKCSGSYSGTVSISGIRLQTNSDNVISLTGANATVLNLINCNINATNNDAISSTGSNSAATIILYNCTGDLGTTGIKLHAVTNGNLEYRTSYFTNSGNSTTASTFSGVNLAMRYCAFLMPFSCSGSTAVAGLWSTNIDTTALGVTAFAYNSTVTGSQSLRNVDLISGTATPLTIGSGASISVANITLSSSNSVAISGAGTLIEAGINQITTVGTVTVTNVTSKGDISGSWTPTLTGSTGNPTPTYTSQVGTYYKINRLVFVTANISVSALTGGTGNFEVSGLPFTASNTSNAHNVFAGIYLNANVLRAQFLMVENTTKCGFVYTADGGSALALPQTATTGIQFSGCYTTSN